MEPLCALQVFNSNPERVSIRVIYPVFDPTAIMRECKSTQIDRACPSKVKKTSSTGHASLSIR
jgi:hypothetical protein